MDERYKRIESEEDSEMEEMEQEESEDERKEDEDDGKLFDWRPLSALGCGF